jgi:outer membrane protein OmpA-like peptidoglycan-associated protein
MTFGSGRSQLSDSAKGVLRRWLAGFESTTPGTILIVGYGDSRGTSAQNGKLALERARAVATFIEAQRIPASRLTVRGAGDPGRTQAFNRLVIISVTEPASSAP